MSTAGRHWWDRQLRSKWSLRIPAYCLGSLAGQLWCEADALGFMGMFALLNVALLAAEGLAALWPSAFGRRPHTQRRLARAWRTFNEPIPRPDGPS